MPYIIKAKRLSSNMESAISEAASALEKEPTGVVVYFLARILMQWAFSHGMSFQTMANVHSALSTVDKEIYRRVTAHYEKEKAQANGDIPEFADWSDIKD
jgi:hypothetical protein